MEHNTSTMRQAGEAEIIQRQVRLPEAEASIVALRQFASSHDIVIVAISALCALAAGAIVPLPSV